MTKDNVQEPEYWNVIDPAGDIVASETDAIRGWARIAGSYKPTVEGLLGFHEQGWRVLPKVAQPAAQPAPVQEPVAWTARELELIDGMIRVQLDHAERCDSIANRTMAEKQKCWDLERVAVLHKIRFTPPAAQRQWVGLTDEDWEKIAEMNSSFEDIVAAVEATLKEKNT